MIISHPPNRKRHILEFFTSEHNEFLICTCIFNKYRTEFYAVIYTLSHCYRCQNVVRTSKRKNKTKKKQGWYSQLSFTKRTYQNLNSGNLLIKGLNSWSALVGSSGPSSSVKITVITCEIYLHCICGEQTKWLKGNYKLKKLP